ncbi:Fumarylacetoacetate hydrolase domain-containing protein 2 [Colletotrichum tanaceti]|uniref:Fumarylacetoacetate hydrolase domain-containing protein 2 n=1 Tax=Colletotrichum tanaceti TaxID=1306861 RepID=A0A4U6XJ24_9PEZI|nr:Fumarylacetoacetate hydrolase domain-containing protein 2 [Colletotrichum tanaceti]TKW55980.1 Fumarylacetoacetate hydrolase domain-containing protein 2 [Colletotrichum tanaceti]
MASAPFSRLVRFVPRSDPSKILIGEPESASVDVGVAVRNGDEVKVAVWSGSSVLAPGSKTDQRAVIDRVLSPVSADEVGTIRCIGLNYVQHAKEVGVALPDVPTVFFKPSTALADPWPAPTVLPHLTQADDCGDYESELAVVLGRTAKNVAEADAMDYVLGYTACNDVSSRTYQLNQSQWCFAKGFDGSCPLGPTLVSKDLIPDPSKLKMRGLWNGDVLQESGIDDLIFNVPKIISFLSQSTTLPAGTVIITGTPAGVGLGRKPKVTLKHGDEFRVEILPHIGTLVNVFENEQ